MFVSLAGIGRGLFGPLAFALIAASAEAQADPLGVTWEEKFEVTSGKGYRGPWRMNDSEFDFVDDPTVAITEEGFVGIAWVDQSRQDIFFQLFGPDGKGRLEEPVNVSKSPQIFSWLPRMVIAPGEASEVYILWQEIIFSGGSHGGEILFARSANGGRTFSQAINLSNSIAGDGKGRLTLRSWHNGSLDLAISPQGNLYAAWSEYEGNLWFSRSTDRGSSFSDPLLIAGGPDAKPARGPSLSVSAEGAVYLAWTVGEDRAANIHFAMSEDSGRSFSATRTVFESDGHADAPKIAVDGRGTVHLVYAESPAGPFQRYHIRYTQLDGRGRILMEPSEISGPSMTGFEISGFPALSLDGEDNIYVAWELFANPKGYSRGLGYTTSSDGGRTFALPSVIPGSVDPAHGVNGSQQGLLMRKLAVNGAGRIAVVNSTFKKNRASRIWLTRGQASGR
ncbi:MAG: sialidase family protein [Kiloniellales bacterium]|nr:sialidase family protein [Kiloniellales bacterium]